MPFGVDLKKFKLNEKSPAAKYVNPAIEKVDAFLAKFEKPKTEAQPPKPPEAPTEVNKEEEKK